MATLLRFWKPYGVLSQFTDADGRPTLAHHIDRAGVYPAGRLDRDSEGLLLLTDSGVLQSRLSDPRHGTQKTYLALVESVPGPSALRALRTGVTLRDGPARAVRARCIDAPVLPERDPAPRPRAGRATAWVEIVLTEGRNRQVRRMLAAVGSPVLRLVRTRVGTFDLVGLAPGDWSAQSLHAPSTAADDVTRASRRPPRDRSHAPGSSARRPRRAPSSRTRRGS